MAEIRTNAFSACTPSIGTTISQTGTVTQCSAIPMESDEVTDIYLSEGNPRIMGRLFEWEGEVKACMAEQKGLAGFLLAHKVERQMSSTMIQTGLYEVQPFFLKKRNALINNEYWNFTGGELSLANGTPDPAGTYWKVTATSPTGIPNSTGWFNTGERQYLFGITAGGTSLATAYTVTLATIVGSTIEVVLDPQNAGSSMGARATTNPTAGYIVRGTRNVKDVESFCAEIPGLNTTSLVPYWIETVRVAMVRSELYKKFLRLLMGNNPAFQTFLQIPEVELNRQIMKDFQKRMMNDLFYSKPISASQTTAAFRALPQVTVASGAIITGFPGGSCYGFKANMVGFLEQHAACGRVYDLQGGQLNLLNLFQSIYNMMRVRKANGSTASAKQFDVFTDEVTALQINTAMLSYYKGQSQDMLRINIDLTSAATPKVSPMGFNYRAYPLFFPAGVTMNVITDEFFDDMLTNATAAGAPSTGRWLLIMDWTQNYMATLASNKRVNIGGKLDIGAAVDTTLACVMERPETTYTMFSHTRAAVSECPAGDLIIQNFSNDVPNSQQADGAGSYG